ncbi:hypothetical protein [Arthrobacter sp. TB 23]|uniref:hypothetical protein n=1 Tax=Arthrobacter sp. TB 23 TaxID=494419 RepID=UPI0002F75049|nr:hypothetical protein [Arthrobacter sp. TB 23]
MRREPEHRRSTWGRKALVLTLVAGLNLTGAGAALAADFQPGHQASASIIHQSAPAAPAGNTQPAQGIPHASAGNQIPEPHTEVENRIREGEGRATRRTDESTL